MRNFPRGQGARNHARNVAAFGQHGVSQDGHESNPAAAVDHMGAPSREGASEFLGSRPIFRSRAHPGPGKDTNASHTSSTSTPARSAFAAAMILVWRWEGTSS